MDFYRKSGDEVIRALGGDLENGLSEKKVREKAEEFGLNELESKSKSNSFLLFARQFRSFIIYILIFALLISVLVGEYVDAGVIVAILMFNAMFGFIQEYRAEKSIEALRKLTALKSRVVRGGVLMEVDAKDVVPGDLIVLNEGDKIPADARIVECMSLQTLESSLTGESAPVSKNNGLIKEKVGVADRKNMVFSGTVVTKGRGKAIVVATGMKTEIGKIAGMVTELEKEVTPLQKKLNSLGKKIGLGVIIISAVVFALGIFREGLIGILLAGDYYGFVVEAKEWFLTAVALAVAAVPEGLPAIVTISLALGVRKMVKRNALIRRLPSVETLGETTIICSDKTGTLTKNEMLVRRVFVNGKILEISGEGYEADGKISGKFVKEDELLFRIGALCNNASIDKDLEVIGDPTEAALLVSAGKAGIDYVKLKKDWKRINEEPFDSERKMMSVVCVEPNTRKEFVFTKGAPEKIVERCSRILVNGKILKLSESGKNKILEMNDEFASKALRVLGFAYSDTRSGIEKNMIFVGLQGMIDPPRKEVREAVEMCRNAGIRVVMVTGDNKKTAQAVAAEVGMEGDAIEGVEFMEMSDEEKEKAVERVGVFARVEPKHKMEIVGIFQRRGQVIAMTGDGVNDAPALKKADIGIAMGIKGTDVSKEASDMVLQDDNFSSIVGAIEEGRGIYDNIRKFVNYLLSSNLAEVLVIALAVVLGWPLPMTAVMLLWINLVTDGFPALALSADPYGKDLMKRPPKKAKEGIMNRSMVFNVFYVGTLVAVAVLGLFYWAMVRYSYLEPFDYIQRVQTIAFSAIIVMELVRLQAIRYEYKLGVFSNKYLVGAVLVSFGLHLLVVYTQVGRLLFGTAALSLVDWGAIVGVSAGVFVLNFVGIYVKNKMKWFRD